MPRSPAKPVAQSVAPPHTPVSHTPMKLSLFSDYSLRTLLFAAIKGATFQIDEVTSAYGISRHHLAKVVQNLSRLGYLETRRGRKGGIRLAVRPDEVRLGQLLRKSEEGSVLLECFDPTLNTCPITGCCRLKGILAGAIRAFYGELDRYTLKDLVDENHRPALRKILLSADSSRADPAPNLAPPFGDNG
jgi:Rrf2 family nitric oxide-sensitive transcriptional repressor